MRISSAIDYLTKSNKGLLCQVKGEGGGFESGCDTVPPPPPHFIPVQITGAAQYNCEIFGK